MLSLAEKEEKIQVLGELLRNYQHLTAIDISGNEIFNIDELVNLKGLLQIKASGNKIKSIACFEDNSDRLEFLQVSQIQIEFSCNRLMNLVPGPQPKRDQGNE
jgi:Leucine-rich repeat (LRR) protein